MNYTPLHVHTEYSTGFDGYQTLTELIDRCKELGITACANTEHGTMKSTLDFYMACKEAGIKPIIGMEAYFTPDVTIKERKFTYHLILIAKNNEGYLNLKKLDSIAYQNFYYKPRIDWDILMKHKEGLIVCTACMASIFYTDNGKEWFARFKKEFGDDFYAEIQPNDIPEQQEYNERIVAWAKEYSTDIIVTTDAHFSRSEDEPYHKLWTQITGGDGYHDNENYIWSVNDLRATHLLPEGIADIAIENTNSLADKCEVTLEMEGNHYPQYPTEDAEEEIRQICRKAWKSKVPADRSKEYAKRFNTEIETLKQVGYLNYLLITYDILHWCETNRVARGVGRGSVSGSLVAYLMGIHKVDPIKYNLKFFRFVNPFRVSPCDVDNDVSTKDRGKVINYIKEKYGYVSKIYTVGKLGDKSAIQRAGQVLKLDPSVIDDITKQVETSIDDINNASTSLTDNEKATLIDVAKHFVGRIEKYGIHASAVLITPDAIENYCPLEGCWSTDAGTGQREWIYAAAYDWHKLESEFGLLKEDILGLNTLDIISGTGVNVDNIDTEDEEVYKMYSEGNLSGVFQMESKGMQHTAKELGVSNFNDIVALVALFRPGPIDSGMLQQYIDGKHGAEISYPCEAYKQITEDTYGVIVYQEQAMLIAMKMAGYNLGQADVLRKIIGRKELSKIDKAIEEFTEACREKGYDDETIDFVSAQLKAAGKYIFNKAHSTSYSFLSYITAYLKCHYPKEFMCSVINSKNNQEDILPYINECKRLGINILEPDYSVGNRNWVIEGDSIRMGLTYIKGVGKDLRIVTSNDWNDIINANNKRVTLALIKAGALDYTGNDRGWMVANFDGAQGVLKRRKQCEDRLEELNRQLDEAMDDKEVKKYTRLIDQWQTKLAEVEFIEEAEVKYDLIAGEMEVLSFSFHELPSVIVGTAKIVNEFKDKKGNLMARITFDTPYGNQTGLVFASKWKKEKYRDRFKGWCKGITIEQSKQYEIMIEDGILVDAKEV